MENIISKAIEGGFDKHFFEETQHITERFMILHPLFWQALGKSLGWNTNMDYRSYTISSGNPDLGVLSTEMRAPRWLFESIRFHEINLTEGWDSAVEYLTNLIERE